MSCFEQEITIYVNISPTLRYGGSTGIQRVVRKLFDELHEKTVNNLTFVFGACTTNGWYTARPDDLRPVNTTTTVSNEKQLGQFWLFKLLPDSVKSLLRIIYRRFIAKDIFAGKPLIALPEDAWILELDSPWIDDWLNYPQFKNTINLIYDVTPLSHPEYCNPEACDSFFKWLRHALPKARGVISISKTSLNNIFSNLDIHGIKYPSCFGFFYLGSDLKSKTLCSPQISDPNFLYVGSISPHKNIALLLDAYIEYRSAGGNWPLVILGRSSGFGDLDSRLISLKEIGLVWLDDADDDCLHQAYAQCAVVIAPSIWEGFGLPLFEAMNFQKTIIASDIEVYQELAAGAVNFFDVRSSSSLANRMQAAEQGSLMASCGAYVPGLLNWQQSANFFAETLSHTIKEITEREQE